MPNILVQRLLPSAQLPRYAHADPFGDLAADLFAAESLTLAPIGEPGSTQAVRTGIALELPATHGAVVEDRSGLALRGITTLAGVIDPGYRGELKVVLANLSSEPHLVAPATASPSSASSSASRPPSRRPTPSPRPRATPPASAPPVANLSPAGVPSLNRRRPHPMSPQPQTPPLWPTLPWQEWQPTADTLHMWTQIVGKTRLALTPVQNHWWNIPLYLTARGLTTSAMPLPSGELLDIEFDFLDHTLNLRHSSGHTASLALRPRSVADFFADYTRTLTALAGPIPIDPMPVELKAPIRFDRDTTHASYDPDAAHRFWQTLAIADTLFKRFSTNFLGKISPVHFFWGSFDLAVTRFSSRPAPPRPGADSIQAEAYSHEVISAGFWPGNGGYGQAAFYCYAAPVPAGLAQKTIPGPGAYDTGLGEFLLRYDDARSAPDPAQTVLDFLENTYAAAADAAGWDRSALDRHDAIATAAVRVPHT